LLVPVWRYFDAYDAANAAPIYAQQAAQRAEQPQLAGLLAALRRNGPGRVYAGSAIDNRQSVSVGDVPMYAYLASLDVDAVGFTLRTASLMSQPEYHFDAANTGDYQLFGIRYLIVPAPPGSAAPPASVPVYASSRFWVLKPRNVSYIRVADTIGSITAGRADIGSRTAGLLDSPLPGMDRYLTVGYSGAPAAAATLSAGDRAAGSPGTVLTERPDLAGGQASAVVRLHRRAVVVLAASYDPGWSATVDGHPAAVQMLAPALVGVTVPAGLHLVAFSYSGFGAYPPLLALAAAVLLAVAALTLRWRPHRF
jgi:hypothetical protein